MPVLFRAGCLLAALLALQLACPATTEAQVRRCTTADGGTLYTDQSCAKLGAVERTPRDADAARRPYRGGCARRLQDLVFEVTSAIDAHDTNRLAGAYHWPGMSSRGGYGVIERLDAIAQRPLVDITALRPAEPVVVVEHRPGESRPVLDGTTYPQVRPSRAPVALRVDQTLKDGITPSRTTFGLRKHMDCWWITL